MSNDLILPIDTRRPACLGLWRSAHMQPVLFCEAYQGDETLLIGVQPDGTCYAWMADDACTDAGRQITTRVQAVLDTQAPMAKATVEWTLDHHAPLLYCGAAADGPYEGPALTGPLAPDAAAMETWSGTPTDDRDLLNNARQAHRSDYACQIPTLGRYLWPDTGMELNRPQLRVVRTRMSRRFNQAILELTSLRGQITAHKVQVSGPPLIPTTQPDT